MRTDSCHRSRSGIISEGSTTLCMLALILSTGLARSQSRTTDYVIASRAIAANTALNFKLPNGLLLTGKITDAAGGALEGALVQALDGNSDLGPSTVTDASGTFVIAVRSGTYDLLIKPPAGDTVDPRSYPRSVDGGVDDLQVSKDTSAGTVALQDGYILSGSVQPPSGKLHALAGLVLGIPPDRVLLGVIQAHRGTGNDFSKYAMAVPAGKHKLFFTGGQALSNESQIMQAGSFASVPATVTKDTVKNIKLPVGYRLTGHVRDAQGRALSGILFAKKVGTTTVKDAQSTACIVMNGAYASCLPAGQYDLTFIPLMSTAYGGLAAQTLQTVTMSAADRTYDVTAADGLVVSGKVADAANKALGGATITFRLVAAEARAASLALVAQTDAKGKYRICVPAGTYRIRASPPGVLSTIIGTQLMMNPTLEQPR
ncbi:MAG: carboxypeptidase regulatory-like domain-containing protein [Acidobacteriota bacterium]